MTTYSAADAAILTGKSKPTILKALREGKIVSTKDNRGEYRIFDEDLFRVYARVDTRESNRATDAGDESSWFRELIEELREEKRVLEQTLKAEREAAESEKDELSRKVESREQAIRKQLEEHEAQVSVLQAELQKQDRALTDADRQAADELRKLEGEWIEKLRAADSAAQERMREQLRELQDQAARREQVWSAQLDTITDKLNEALTPEPKKGFWSRVFG